MTVETTSCSVSPLIQECVKYQQRLIGTFSSIESLAAEFVEVESGGRTDRPKLIEALTTASLLKATLIIAKLDRLARNVAFVSNLLEAGVDFVATDFPQANRLTIHIVAAFAEHEAKMISDRTRAALAAAKERGTRLGGYRGRAGTCTDCARARAIRTAKANRRASDLAPTIQTIRAAGGRSLRSIASGLNAQAIAAPRGGSWTAVQVRRALQRIPAIAS